MAVILGFLGKKSSENLGSHSGIVYSKIGGRPTWLFGEAPQEWNTFGNAAALECQTCMSGLELIAQIQASYGDNKVERVLYILGCVKSSKCSLKVKNWRAYRGIRCRSEEAGLTEFASNATLTVPKNRSLKPAEQESSSLDDILSRWSTEPPKPTAHSVQVDFPSSTIETNASSAKDDHHTSSLDEILSRWSTETPKAATPSVQSDVPDKKVPLQNNTLNTKKQDGLPSYWIEECPEDTEASESWKSDSTALHAAELHKRYLEEGDPDGDPIDESGVMKIDLHNSDDVQEDSDDKDFERFQSIIRHNPTQVMRYCFAGKPLWLTKPDGSEIGSLGGFCREPSVCRCCQSQRVHECQIISLLLNDELTKRNPSAMKKYQGLEALGVIVLFTCSNDCKSGSLYTEEEVLFQAAL